MDDREKQRRKSIHQTQPWVEGEKRRRRWIDRDTQHDREMPEHADRENVVKR